MTLIVKIADNTGQNPAQPGIPTVAPVDATKVAIFSETPNLSLKFSVFAGIHPTEERGEGERAKLFLSFIDSAAAVIFRFTGMIIDFTPYAVLALMANAVSRTDMASMMPLIVVLILTYVASIFHSYITTSALLAIFAKVNPLKFFR